MTNDLFMQQEQLCEACDENDINTCKELLTHLDPNFEIEGYQTPLICAILSDNTEIVELLIEHGASLEPLEEGESLLQYTKHHREFLDVGVKTRALLFRHGLDPDYSVNGTTALMDAINQGYFELAEEYLDANARVDVIDKNGWTPVNRILSIISDNSRDRFEGAVLKETPYIERFNKQQSTNIHADELLSYAQIDWSFSIEESEEYRLDRSEPGIRLLKKLIQKGADVSKANDYGWSPLLYASETKYLSDVCKLLVEAGADVNSVDKLGQYSPLMRACDSNQTELALLLLNRGADPTFRESAGGYTPLTRSCIDLNYEVVSMLIEKGADVNAVCHHGSPPLLWMVAVNRGLLSMIEEIDYERTHFPSKETVVAMPLKGRHLKSWLDVMESIIRLMLENNASLFLRNHNHENVYDVIYSSALFDRLKDVLPPVGPRAIE